MKSYILLLAFAFSFLTLSAQEFGLASYYADKYHGKKTAYNEVYDKSKMTAAHKRHPLGTMLRVTRLDNNKSVVVRVNDQGPYLPGRIVDLSMAAAQKIDLVRDGVAQVKVEVVQKSQPAQSRGSTAVIAPTANRSAQTASADSEKQEDARVNVSPVKQTRPQQEVSPYGLYKVSIQKKSNTGFGIQVASMGDYINALRKVGELEANYFDNVLVSVERSEAGTAYKIILGPFDTMDQAKAYNESLQKRYNRQGFVVDFSQIEY